MMAVMTLRTSFDNTTAQNHRDDHLAMHQRYNASQWVDGFTGAAIQAAIDSASGDVYLPAGTYEVASDIVVDKPLILRGAGYGTVLNLDASAKIVIRGSSATGTTIRDMKFVGSGGTGIDVQRNDAGYAGSQMAFSKVFMSGFERGLRANRMFLSRVLECRFDDAPIELFNSGHSNLFDGCWFDKIPSGQYGVIADGSNNIRFFGCTWSAYNTGGSGLLLLNVRNWGVRHCHFEDMFSLGQESTPDGVAIVLGDDTPSFWGSGVIDYAFFLDLHTVLKIDYGPLNSQMCVDMRTVEAPGTSTLVNANNIDRGNILVLDLTDVINDANNIVEQRQL